MGGRKFFFERVRCVQVWGGGKRASHSGRCRLKEAIKKFGRSEKRRSRNDWVPSPLALISLFSRNFNTYRIAPGSSCTLRWKPRRAARSGSRCRRRSGSAQTPAKGPRRRHTSSKDKVVVNEEKRRKLYEMAGERVGTSRGSLAVATKRCSFNLLLGCFLKVLFHPPYYGCNFINGRYVAAGNMLILFNSTLSFFLLFLSTNTTCT